MDVSRAWFCTVATHGSYSCPAKSQSFQRFGLDKVIVEDAACYFSPILHACSHSPS